METFGAILTSVLNALALLIPVIPYLFTIIIAYMMMKKVIKPIIRSHRYNETQFTSNFWMMADKFLFLYPLVIGAVCCVVCNLTLPGFSGPLMYFLFASLVAPYLAAAVEHLAKARGIAIPSDF